MPPTERPALCVSIHDVAPATWPQCERLLRAVRDVARIPVSLLVVPDYHGLPVRDTTAYEGRLEMRLAKGDELVLHGWRHLDEAAPQRSWRDRLVRTVYTRSEGEFYAINYEDACWRLQQGVDWFAQRGWPLEGFVPPAWLLGPAAWRALYGFRFRYVTTRRHLHLLPSREAIASESLVYSVGSAWRRGMSYAWNAVLLQRLRGAPLVRLSLHPVDAEHPEVVANARRLIERLLVSHDAMTKAAFVRRLAEQTSAAVPPFNAGAGPAAP
ncbi:DUF2334 domain-containing protein [Oxalobacteraceae bacterium OM1]|nr:DUF2334 domain-containing protein [Oxalobacteraceae bacterium OM1]